MQTDQKQKELYALYARCFPYLYTEEEDFAKRLTKDAALFTVEADEKTVGFCLTLRGTVLVLCVDEAHRRQGHGSSLLQQAEAHIKRNAHKKILLGQGGNGFFQGVPVESGTHPFFEKRGYVKDWESIDMVMDILAYQNTLPIPAGISFRFAQEADEAAIQAAVHAVDEDWCQFFTNAAGRALLATEGEQIVAFLLISDSKDTICPQQGLKIGDIGCVGTVPSARNRGIGLSLVSYATALLQGYGCDTAYIGCTYLEDWYGKLGYRTWIRFWMGEKEI